MGIALLPKERAHSVKPQLPAFNIYVLDTFVGWLSRGQESAIYEGGGAQGLSYLLGTRKA